MRKLILLFTMLTLVCACQFESTVDTSFSLYYSGVTEICPGTSITLNPTWHGAAPTDFKVSGVKYNGKQYETSCFTVNPDNGTVAISGTENLPTGDWTIGISCMSEGILFNFEKAVEVTLMKPVPDYIKAVPSEIETELSLILEGSEELPTSAIVADGHNHVKIRKFILANVYRNGELANECKDWFDLSKQGVLSIVPGTADFEPGIYTFDFRLTTYAADEQAEEGLFKKALKLNVKSSPISLDYGTVSMKVEQGYGGKTDIPAFKGSNQNLVFSILSVAPDNTPGITVDEVNGRLIFPEDSPAKEGEVYTVSVTATNEYGSKDFNDVFTFNVIDFIRPITVFKYETLRETISGASISCKVAEVDGDDVQFAFKDLPAGLSGLKVDRNTGEITCAKGTELTPGDYEVCVVASNLKSKIELIVPVKILPNPYKFTTVFWGNNMGLTPEEDYGNQIRSFWEDEPIVVPVKYSDIPAGVPVEFTYTYGYEYSNCRTGVSIDKNTGTVTVYPTRHIIQNGKTHLYYSKTDYVANRVHVGWITVKVGGNDEAAVTKMFPFFVQHVGYSGSYPGILDGAEHPQVDEVAMDYAYQFLYTPFAFRVNPKRGGRSNPPVVSHLDGRSCEGVTLEYRRSFCYYNFYGPEEHAGSGEKFGLMSATNKNLLYTVFSNYAQATGTVINLSASYAVGYWANKNYLKGWLGYTGCYIDANDLSLVVNPERWVDDYGYANGAFVANLQFNLNGNDPTTQANTDMQTLPIIVWLDDTYNK